MSDEFVKNGNVALITGASSGIGAAFARKLAAEGYDLILVARRGERLTTLATELQQRHSISAEILVADLSKQTDVEQVENRIAEMKTLDVLINNAGFGTSGKFAESDLAKQIGMIHVHVIASVRLCRAALPGMIARRRGAIINVSSLGAFIPIPGNVTYVATKRYLVTFSQALQVEMAGSGVKVQALCPGFTYTEFHDTAEFETLDHSQIPKLMWMSAEDVVAGSLKALRRNRVVYIPGFKNRLLVAVAGSPPITSLLLWVLSRRRK
ncbi:MAG: SDR family oxidoreductase [Anaerolineae bacterium]|nr:SDR family oxidoreductase [Anaerolineae bacterium]